VLYKFIIYISIYICKVAMCRNEMKQKHLHSVVVEAAQDFTMSWQNSIGRLFQSRSPAGTKLLSLIRD